MVQQQVPGWTPRDSALWHTCDLVADLAAGRPVERLLDVLTPFPPQLDDDELAWASGPYDLLELVSGAETPVQKSAGILIPTGPIGLAASAAIAAGRAAHHSRRRRQAAAQAVPHWVPSDSGTCYVSEYGLTLHSARGLYPWPWRAVRTGSMAGPRAFQLTGESSRGTVSWMLHSDWAELAFATWALTVHPRHPQLVSGQWLPPGWLEHAAAAGYGSRLRTAAIQAAAQPSTRTSPQAWQASIPELGA